MKELTCKKCNNKIAIPPDYTDGYIARCANCNAAYRVNKQREPLSEQAKQPVTSQPPAKEELPFGWLHDSNSGIQISQQPLCLGDNSIGRKAPLEKGIVFIESEDPYLSRQHCNIHVRVTNRNTVVFILSDLKSRNGTFILNGKKETQLREHDQVVLEDESCFRIGNTLLTLKVNTPIIDALAATPQQSNAADNSDKTVFIKL